jgi:hypothetical protein
MTLDTSSKCKLIIFLELSFFLSTGSKHCIVIQGGAITRLYILSLLQGIPESVKNYLIDEIIDMMCDAEALNVLHLSDPMVGVVSSIPKRGKSSFLLLLPLELQRRITPFLHPEDAMNLTESGVATNRMIVRALNPDRHPGKPLPPIVGSYRTGDRPRPSGLRLRLITEISKDVVHSMTLHAQWKDQGWGNQKGELFIAAHPRISTEEPDAVPGFSIDFDVDDDRDPFDGGRVVAMTTEMAPHEWGHVELTFTPREGEVYYLWYRVGGGGGHELRIKDCRLQTFVYDDMDNSFSNTYQVLYNLGVVSCTNLCSLLPPKFPVFNSAAEAFRPLMLDMKSKYFQIKRDESDMFYPNLLLRLVQSGLRQLAIENEGASPSPDSSLGFLLENGLQFNEATLHATEAIVQSYIDELNYDWLVYSMQRQKFRSLYPELSGTNRQYRERRELLQVIAGNGTHRLQGGDPIVQRTIMNGFRIVMQQADGPLIPADGGGEVHVERIPPPQGVAEGNVMLPQVVNNPDGTVSILLGNLGENVGAVAWQEMEMDPAPPVQGPAPPIQGPSPPIQGPAPPMQGPAPPFGMFGIARAAMAAAFGFAANVENDAPPPANNPGQVVMEDVTVVGTNDDFGPAAAFFAAMAEEMQAGLVQENNDMDEDAEEIFAQ